MRPLIGTCVLFAVSGGMSLLAQQPSARDAFWSASDLFSVSSNPGAGLRGSNGPAKKGSVHAASGHSTSRGADSGPHVDPVLVAENGYGSQPHLFRVSSEQIGLRYSLLLQDATGKYSEVSPAAVFHSGDHIRLSVMANQPGYLYVIQQGSTGSWSPIFPAAGSAEEANKVEQGRVFQIPNGRGAFSFDQNAGKEKLFIVLSRQPLRDLDSTIQRLKITGGTQPHASQPAAQAGEPAPVYEALNRIPDELVQRLASRDLTLVQEQAVDEPSQGSQAGEKAVYVVSKASVSGAGPQVVASVTLQHE